jgi:ketosteroid isomerase-like protein
MGTGWHTRGVPACGPWPRERRDCPQQPRQDVGWARRKSTLPHRKKILAKAGRVPDPRGARPGAPGWARRRGRAFLLRCRAGPSSPAASGRRAWPRRHRAGGRPRRIGAVVAHHTDDVVMFDVPPPVVVRGIAAYRRTWPPFFRWQRDENGTFDIVELNITAGDTVAFATVLLRCGSKACHSPSHAPTMADSAGACLIGIAVDLRRSTGHGTHGRRRIGCWIRPGAGGSPPPSPLRWPPRRRRAHGRAPPRR